MTINSHEDSELHLSMLNSIIENSYCVCPRRGCAFFPRNGRGCGAGKIRGILYSLRNRGE